MKVVSPQLWYMLFWVTAAAVYPFYWHWATR